MVVKIDLGQLDRLDSCCLGWSRAKPPSTQSSCCATHCKRCISIAGKVVSRDVYKDSQQLSGVCMRFHTWLVSATNHMQGGCATCQPWTRRQKWFCGRVTEQAYYHATEVSPVTPQPFPRLENHAGRRISKVHRCSTCVVETPALGVPGATPRSDREGAPLSCMQSLARIRGVLSVLAFRFCLAQIDAFAETHYVRQAAPRRTSSLACFPNTQDFPHQPGRPHYIPDGPGHRTRCLEEPASPACRSTSWFQLLAACHWSLSTCPDCPSQ